ncbi:hypothetical protein J7M28_12555 [bacterium]|nr:hypothetical protein [bacterium]
MIHFLCLFYLSLAISIVVSATGTNDRVKIVKNASKYFAALFLGSIVVGWMMFIVGG